MVNEVSSQGSSGVCNGRGWVELYNPGRWHEVDTSQLVLTTQLQDENGECQDKPDWDTESDFGVFTCSDLASYSWFDCDAYWADEYYYDNDDGMVTVNEACCFCGGGTQPPLEISNSMTLSSSPFIPPAGYLLLCNGVDFDFDVAGDSTITLSTADGTEVSSSGQLGGVGAFDISWALDVDGTYLYTTSPTPGAQNAGNLPSSTLPASLPLPLLMRLAESCV